MFEEISKKVEENRLAEGSQDNKKILKSSVCFLWRKETSWELKIKNI